MFSKRTRTSGCRVGNKLPEPLNGLFRCEIASPYRTVNNPHLAYNNERTNTMIENIFSVFRESYETHKYDVMQYLYFCLRTIIFLHIVTAGF
jgi:hypothetical protein